MASPREFFVESEGTRVGLDVYLPTSARRRCPCMIWFHGGGLLQGSRKSALSGLCAAHSSKAAAVWKHLLDAPDKHELCVISADYRLAPQVKMGQIMDDIRLVVDFVRHKLPADLLEMVDPSRLVVSGGSAGGWLALLAGTGIVQPPPNVVCAIYPITSSTDAFFSTPMKPHPPFLDKPLEYEEFAPYLDPKAPVIAASDPKTARARFYFYMQQEGNLTQLLFEGSGLDPKDYEIVRRLGKLDKSQVAPTYLVHGDPDAHVATDHSRTVAQKLKEMGVTYEYDELPGKPHLYDKDPEETMDNMYAFIARWI